jgi:hypothetical protein
VLCALPVGIRDQLPQTSRVIAALRGLHALPVQDLPRADQARIQHIAREHGSPRRWQRSRRSTPS